jgi:hypothetical protein
MRKEASPRASLVELVDTPATEPIRVPCVRWQQAGHDVFSAICPKCRPGLTLEQLGDGIQSEGHGHVHLNDEGRIICRCGAYLELYLPE